MAVSACAGSASAPATPPPSPAAIATATAAAAPGTAARGCTAKPTVAQTEGPYFKAGSPAKTNLVVAGMAGTPLALTGHVLDAHCAPAAGAMLDFWQADGSGAYDNSGYRLRGHQSAGSDGAYHLDTIIPGLYPGRTEHIHVKVGRPGTAPLTTQLYFPGVARNQQDGIFDPSLLVNLSDSGGGKLATFDFVLG
jgi:protocatechuate 3,4-dioxygenase beta subunit